LQEVIVVGATNRPEVIDKALMRPGRLDRIIYVPLPDANTRKEIINIRFRKTPTAADVDKETLIRKTEGFSGAEVFCLLVKKFLFFWNGFIFADNCFVSRSCIGCTGGRSRFYRGSDETFREGSLVRETSHFSRCHQMLQRILRKKRLGFFELIPQENPTCAFPVIFAIFFLLPRTPD
jgi:hypothetical protein